ncbi:MBL fold metallo-hydrolase [Roseibium denhamense]|uniref:Glyoxylase, beta-lactamase superfamily II n=1 Tax=Roseibium denhamense TaxID=76305 RepID=A0ABY1P501_9HYPH|nr:MBL fold metallo-hydrolase [Roseibium denhamense]MTI07288.1 MBL fold metallo-hydrolase [Roseibium denhamense]SMP26099.1 Glyoxylase, beta-lactamase superfamily II [Roseibium denhamense]
MKHDRVFDPCYGQAIELSDGIRRLTARNPGPFTFHGTNTYILGQDRLIVVDPGPAQDDHIDAILNAAGDVPVEAILVTHTHADHSPGARLLKAKTGAPVIGCSEHRAARPLFEEEINPLDASADRDHKPDRLLNHGDVISFAGLGIAAVATPGHTANHLSFEIKGTDILLSGDHVMAWSTSIVAPPDGSMRDYMASLNNLQELAPNVYLPGHGGVIRDAKPYVADLKEHRQSRERNILAQIDKGATSIPEIVAVLYANVDPSLHPAAALSVLAHLEDLADRNRVVANGIPSLRAEYKIP